MSENEEKKKVEIKEAPNPRGLIMYGIGVIIVLIITLILMIRLVI